ncbi:DUF4349 domain-containing protein [Funiculus sociatus GB2-A5]|uniref:DUF4349 domain-containing protein n=1 Tax=Funiculus sociatus GB2-A5 TaxID=2933946 RepID=A0ABV0JXD7_9CYAN|nr:MULTISPECIES: DUF4349 domain-containing protein [unclassified Trichocoleus]MBD2002811.1 DUF4349 domain-containing protein [Trichocoleus sp. FACHB-40]MBD2061252.1 DUF4349 domain-containing protein [Trichocoleus sp. FACHB-6]
MSWTLKPSLLLSAFLGGIVLTSCASDINTAQVQIPMMLSDRAVPSPQAMPAPASEALANNNSTAQSVAKAQVPRVRSQLIKNAEIAVSVNSIEKTIQQVTKIVQQQQGDLLGFQDQKPKDGNRHTASMQIRIPQNQLETTLDTLAKLGTVQRRTLTAEDVTDQLVDNEARLRNLRKQESTLLKIMERSGSVGDVLKVADQLSKVRQNIEQIDAQLKNLRSRVAYSTITLTLEENIATTPPEIPLNSQVKETWNQATHSLGELAVGLIRLSIWLAVFSPFVFILVAASLGYNRLKKQQTPPTPPQSEPPKVS